MRKFMASILKTLFGADGQPQHPAAVPRPQFHRDHTPAPKPAAPAPPDMSGGPDHDLALRLRRIFDGRDPTQAGSLHLLGLGSLHDRLGARWADVAARVHALTGKLLDQHLSDQDAWFRHGEESYVVVFAHLGPEQARLVCAKVVEELQVLLLGHADTDSIKVHTAVHEIGSDVVLVPASLTEMLAAARHAADEAAHGPVLIRPTGFRAPLLARAGPPLVRYRPVWDAQKQVLSLYMARCCREREARAPLWGYECLDDPEDVAGILELDLHVAREALETALELYDNRFRFFLSLPLHFESLAATTRRQEVMATLRSIPRHLLPFMTYHLHGVPAGVPGGRLSELVAALKPFGRTIMLEQPAPGTALVAAETAGVRVINMTLPADASLERWRPEVTRFAANAARHRLLSALEGVANLAMEDLCEEAGVRFLSGDLIGGWVDVPEHVVRRSRTDFERQEVNLRPGPPD
ncbi:hypothetical protein [Niveispirillum sp. KHB5.9]|uniref:hypothetical protein n=1 Tax=Niveispirillum sp. KHB5.9 TaxID=3400269 RepID=UPI003A8A75D1